jgi:hypothetical protein
MLQAMDRIIAAIHDSHVGSEAVEHGLKEHSED